ARLVQAGSLGRSPMPATARESLLALSWMDHMGRLLLEGTPASDGRGAAANPLHRPAPPYVTGTSVRDAASGESASFRRIHERSRPQKGYFTRACQRSPRNFSLNRIIVRAELRNPFSHESDGS